VTRLGHLVAALLLGGGLAIAAATGALGHSLLQRSDPAAGSTVATAPAVVRLTFGEAPDPRLSSVKVLDASGRSVAAGPSVAVAGSPNDLQVPLGHLGDGVYTVSWRTVSAVDGHSAAGSFAFGVGVAVGKEATPPGGAAGQAGADNSSASLANDLARFLLLAGLLGIFGAGFVGALIHPRPPRPLVGMAILAWGLLAAGTVAVIALQVADAQTTLGDFLGSGLGAWALRRLVVLLAAGALIGFVARRPEGGRRGYGAITVAAILAMLLDVITGHAAARGLLSVQVVVQSIHLLAVGLWMGGLVALMLSIRGATSDEKAIAAKRFSRWAGIGLAALAVSGVIRAIDEVGTIGALVSTDFGRLVVLKSVLFVGLGVLGAVNHFWSVPAAARTLDRLRRIGRVEVTVALVALVATGVLMNLAPPSSIAAATAPQVAPLIVTGHDAGTSVKVRLVVTPGAAGQNAFGVAVTDFDTGAPVAAPELALRFKLDSASGVGDSTLALTPASPGSFEGSGTNLSLDGIWTITATIGTPAGNVEVPLGIATAIPDQQIEVNASPGVPTILTAHLDGATSLQVYLDPGTAGQNELHATFFDAAGNELPVPTATYLVRAGTDTTVLTPRQLEPGHFVTEVQPVTGTLVVDVVGTAPAGGTLHAHLSLTVAP
jgi:copper transport protein